MGEEYLNGRVPRDWELPAVEHARECERARDLELLAGVLTGAPQPRPPRPVTDLILEFS